MFEAKYGGLAQRVKETQFLGQSVWDLSKVMGEMGLSTAVGFGVKTGTKLLFNVAGASGLGVTVAVGVTGGAAIAGFKEIGAQRKAYRKSAEEFGLMFGDFYKQGAWDEYTKLGSQIKDEQDIKIKEALSDRKRHLAVFIKRQEMAAGANTTRAVLDSFLDTKIVTDDARDDLFKTIQNAGILNWQRLGSKVGMGAIKGAVGALVGGWISDLIFDSSTIEAASVTEVTPKIEEQLNKIITIPASSNESDIQQIITEHIKKVLGREVLPYEVESAFDLSKLEEMGIYPSSNPEIKLDAETLNEFINSTLRGEQYNVKFKSADDLSERLYVYLNTNLLYDPSPGELEKATQLIQIDNPNLMEQLTLAESGGEEVELKVNFHSLNEAIAEARAEGRGLIPDLLGSTEPSVTKLFASLEFIELPAGSSPWNIGEELGRQALGGEKPSASTIFQITKSLCLDNNISVPEWGIEGEIPADKINAGTKFILGPLTKQALAKFST